jgi:Cys-tRNA(Pro)/Cys-tRNA(Cys) deacylase
MRLLDGRKIPYEARSYEPDPTKSGEEIARLLNEDPEKVYKTLVTEGKPGHHYVFVIPVGQELDLKKAAKAAGEKSVAMIRQKDLLALTGYVHGGCSPVGMKKLFPTYLDASCLSLPSMTVSAGKIGFQIELAPKDLLSLCRGRTADLAAPSAEEDDETNP